MNRKPALTTYFVLLLLILGADLWSKTYIFEALGVTIFTGDGNPQVTYGKKVIVDNWLWMEASLNLGAFSGWFAGKAWFLCSVAIVAVLVTTFMVGIPKQVARLLPISLGLIAGGALGNLYDRLTIGGVRDFIRVFYVDSSHQEHVWPNFNIADSAICVGVGLILIGEIFTMKNARKEAKKS